jgi:hypothetical protein
VRHLVLVVITLGSVLVSPMLAAPAGAKSARLPTLIAGSWVGIKPTDIDFSADGGNVVTQLRWKSWGHNTAIGSGTSDIQRCVPNCAQGTARRVVTRITLSNPRDGHFTKIIEVRDRYTYVVYYRHRAWPLGAS